MIRHSPFLPLLLLVMMLSACDSADRPTLALYLAVEREDIDQIQRHIDWGTDINQLNPDGRRPLHVASAQGEQVIVRLLLKHGADINAEDSQGISPLTVAVMNGRTQLAEFLIKKGAQFDPDKLLFAAVRNRVEDRDVYRLLISLNADLNKVDDSGNTPLILAIKLQERLVVKNLINYGADPNRPGADQVFPLRLAEESGNEDIVRLLRRNGARQTL